MDIQDVIEEVKLELTGGVLELEIEDETIALVVKKALRELQRYWDEPSFLTLPFKSCVDLGELGLEYCSIVKVYRLTGMGNSDDATNALTMDPLFAQQ